MKDNDNLWRVTLYVSGAQCVNMVADRLALEGVPASLIVEASESYMSATTNTLCVFTKAEGEETFVAIDRESSGNRVTSLMNDIIRWCIDPTLNMTLLTVNDSE